MNKLIHKIGSLIPNSTAKDWLRRLIFPLLFTQTRTRSVLVGPPGNKVRLQIAHFPFFQERLGEREIDGYLQHYTPKEGDVAINAGGYHGYFSLYLAEKVGATGHIYCFEPDPINANIIRKNIAHNHKENITLIQKGLWNHDSTLPFETRGSSSRLSNNATQKVSVCSLDNELNKRGIKKIDFVSMDIEGAEIEAVEGMKTTIQSNPRISLAIASYHQVEGTRTAERVETALKNLGLTSKTAFPRHLTTYAAASL